MLSSFVPSFLKPVSALCGLASYGDQNVSNVSSSDVTSTSGHFPVEKPIARCISQSCSSAATDCSSSSPHREAMSDEEVCARMAQLGRAARKAGRHVLKGNKLVLS